MQNWIPVPGSTKARLALIALEEFGARGYGEVSVAELCTKAGVTTGALYHHFGGKPGLYRFVRDEAERRILDRMEGAAAAVADRGHVEAVSAALLVGFDTAVRQGLAQFLAATRPTPAVDPVGALLGRLAPREDAIWARILVAAWRAALGEAVMAESGTPSPERIGRARAALVTVVGGRGVPE
jgi:AcrR family transcriptional regulator